MSTFANLIIFKVGGSLSCLGSGYVVQDVLRHQDRRCKSHYHRTVLGLSIVDIFYSFFVFVLGPTPMPEGSYR